ncbi:MAG: tRNA (5-methylaminomethyl-2-thiouridine)(34)-methyltransferase MnmD [bacterium]
MPTIKKTEDGSDTLYSEMAKQTYHSQHGARTESNYIFINTALEEYYQQHNEVQTIRILEIGFGTGLNSLLTQQFAEEKQIKIEYHTIELYPIEESIYSQLNYAQTPQEREVFERIHSAKWIKQGGKYSNLNSGTEISRHFNIYKYEADIIVQLNHFSTNKDILFNVIYFDAFSPDAQPELWSSEVFNNISTISEEGAIITTYCAKGDVRRSIIAAGFTTKKLAGPPGKRHILRGIKEENKKLHYE